MKTARRELATEIADEDELVPTLVYVRPSASGVRAIGRERRWEIPSPPNVFLNRPRVTDPPPPWSKGSRARTVQIRPQRRQSRVREFLGPVTVALLAGIVFNLAVDVRLRWRVAAMSRQAYGELIVLARNTQALVSGR